MRTQQPEGQPTPVLRVVDGIAIVVGVVVGAGIFRAPSVVAGNVDGVMTFLAVWLAGGIISLAGALCYAELASTYPHAGGDYHFLRRSFGQEISFLFAWARLSVIQTGSIALQAYVIGDYASVILPLGGYSSAIYAAIVVILLTGLNMAGVKQGKWTQNIFTAAVLLGLALVVVGGLLGMGSDAPAGDPVDRAGRSLGLAMIYVLLTFGGWNEAAYLSAEVLGGRRSILKVLVSSIALITALYLAVNIAMLAGLGLDGVARSRAVAADVMQRVTGDWGANFISLLVVIAAIGTVNATIFTGARTNYALGGDTPALGFLGRWRARGSTPANALLVQGIVALALIALAALWRTDGFETMVNYTAPVFWFFFLMVGLSLFVLRTWDPQAPRPFAVPLYPFTPLLFCGVCLYMLYSSLDYTRLGAMVGVGVLLAGIVVLAMLRLGQWRKQEQQRFAPVIKPAAAPRETT